MLSKPLRTLSLLFSLQLFATDTISGVDIISRSDLINSIGRFAGNYKVSSVEVYKNETKLTSEEAKADKNTSSLLEVTGLKLLDPIDDVFTLQINLGENAFTNWKMLEGDHTQGDEEIGLDGHTLRTGVFNNNQVGWRKINYKVTQSTQTRVVETLSFEMKNGDIQFRQHIVYYEYPVGTSYKVPRNLTLEALYKLKKI